MKITYQIDKLALSYLRRQFYKNTKDNKPVRLPKFIAWDCTRRCNLQCEHCGASKEKYDTELSTNEIKKIVDDVSKISMCFFGATGGEPLLRKDLLEVLSYAKSKKLETGFASNGFLIDKNKAEEIVMAKVDSVQISIDGLRETHNKIRKNKESFQRAIDAIKNLQNIKLPTLSVATTVTPHNFNELDKIHDILADLKIEKWRIGIVMPIGRAKNSKKLLLNVNQLKELFYFIKSKNHKKMYILIGENLPFLGKYEKIVRDEPIWCPVGITACCVGVDGNIRGCPEQPDTPEFIEGNIKKDSILDIWQKGFKKYRLHKVIENDEKCKNCKDKYSCYGGCHVMRINGNNCIYDLLK